MSIQNLAVVVLMSSMGIIGATLATTTLVPPSWHGYEGVPIISALLTALVVSLYASPHFELGVVGACGVLFGAQLDAGPGGACGMGRHCPLRRRTGNAGSSGICAGSHDVRCDDRSWR